MTPYSKNPLVPRLVPQGPRPPHAFVPGRTAHPISDPAGHSFGLKPTVPAKFDPANWETSKPYLLGFDLFNAAFYWESHEQWESLWHACGRSGPVADFLKGLIKLAAAGVKHLEGNPVGLKSHSCRAAALWRGVAQSLDGSEDLILGLRIGDLVELADSICQQGWPARISLVPACLNTIAPAKRE